MITLLSISSFRRSLAIALCLFAQASYGQSAQELFWADARGIYRSPVDSREVTEVARVVLNDPAHLAVDTNQGKIYWADSYTAKIQRSNLDGSGIEDLVTEGLEYPFGVALDLARGKIYWSDKFASKIQRANLNGTQVEDIITDYGGRFSNPQPTGIAIDFNQDKIYWSDLGQRRVYRANLDGSQLEVVPGQSTSFLQDVALDLSRGKLYIAGLGAIYRSNLDGSDLETILETPSSMTPYGITIHEDEGKMYWTEARISNVFNESIKRANLDGSDIETIIPSGQVDEPYGVFLDLDADKLYFTDVGTNKIQRSNLDGSNIEDLITTQVALPRDLAIDPIGEKLYWADLELGDILRSNFDGSEIEVVSFVSINFPLSVTLDTGEGKMYFIEGIFGSSTRTIYKANLDGSILQEIQRSSSLRDIALDLDQDKYYVTSDFGLVSRANLDGSEIESLTTPADAQFQSIALDVEAGKMYWIDAFTGMAGVRRANLDGTEREALMFNLDLPLGITLDTKGGKMYWTDYNQRKVQRANLDGSGIEDMFDAFRPYAVAYYEPAVRTHVETAEPTPQRGALTVSQNFPNPFTNSTTIEYRLSVTQSVRIVIYDVLGRAIYHATPGPQTAGTHRLVWEGGDDAGNVVSAGLYFVRIETDQGEKSAMPVNRLAR